MKRIMFFVLSLFLLTSCDEMETVVEIDIPPHEPMLVLNSALLTLRYYCMKMVILLIHYL